MKICESKKRNVGCIKYEYIHIWVHSYKRRNKKTCKNFVPRNNFELRAEKSWRPSNWIARSRTVHVHTHIYIGIYSFMVLYEEIYFIRSQRIKSAPANGENGWKARKSFDGIYSRINRADDVIWVILGDRQTNFVLYESAVKAFEDNIRRRWYLRCNSRPNNSLGDEMPPPPPPPPLLAFCRTKCKPYSILHAADEPAIHVYTRIYTTLGFTRIINKGNLNPVS